MIMRWSCGSTRVGTKIKQQIDMEKDDICKKDEICRKMKSVFNYHICVSFAFNYGLSAVNLCYNGLSLGCWHNT